MTFENAALVWKDPAAWPFDQGATVRAIANSEANSERRMRHIAVPANWINLIQ
jgi:hypothetical protein